jgi:hypothetical protein
MSVLYELSKTVTVSTAGTGTGISTGHINGFISDIYVEINKEMASTDYVTVAVSSDADRNVLVISPSTLGSYYHPRVAPVSTTGVAFASTDGNGGVPISFYKEKYKVSVVGGTSLCAAGTTTVSPSVTVKVRWY